MGVNVEIAWQAVTVDDTGVAVDVDSYRVYLDGVLMTETTGGDILKVTKSNLAEGAHQFAVSAVVNGVEGPQSAPVNFTAGSGVPLAPTGVLVTLLP